MILHHHGTAKLVIPIKAIGTSLIARAPAEGFKLVYHDDHGLLERESSVYAALYAYCQQADRARHFRAQPQELGPRTANLMTRELKSLSGEPSKLKGIPQKLIVDLTLSANCRVGRFVVRARTD